MQQYLGFTAGRWLWPSEHMLDSLIAKFKEAGGTVREITRAESPRLSPLWLSASSSARHGLVNHYRDNTTYKALARQKCQKLKLANAAITDMQMRQRDAAALDAKYTKEFLAIKLKMMLMDDVAAGRRRLHITVWLASA